MNEKLDGLKYIESIKVCTILTDECSTATYCSEFINKNGHYYFPMSC